MPAVSVVVAVRDGEQYLRHALGSVCRQTMSDLELIVVDDGSTDATPSIIREIAATDARVRMITGPATGSAGSARNAGLEVATGDYLAFLDADDFFAPTLLARLHARAEADRADVTATGFRVFDEPGREPVPVSWGLRTALLPSRTPFAPEALGGALFYAFGPVAWNKLFRADFVRRHGLRFQELRRTNDLHFTFSAIALAERLSYVDRALIDYRIGNPASLQGSTHATPLDFAEALGALQSTLREAGLASRHEAAFVNEAVEVSLANLERASTFAAYAEIDSALRGGLLAGWGALDRPPAYFVTTGLARRLSAYLEMTSEEFLFGRAVEASRRARTAQAEARTAVRTAAGWTAGTSAPAQPPELPRPAAGQSVGATGAPDVPVGVPDVSVIIPVHNTAPWLQECLDGVRRQTGLGIEVICVDDGSSDSCPDILEQAAAGDPRIHVIHQQNAGLSAARNRGLVDASGRYVCFLDSDDYWGIDGLAALVAAADEALADVVLFDADTVAEPGVDARTVQNYRGYYHRSRSYAEVVPGPELMARMKMAGDYRVQACLYVVRRAFAEQQRLRFVPGLPREDNLFTFELLLRAARATHRQTPLYVRRLRPGSLITAGSRASAARGYYVSFVEMLRLTAGRSFEDWIGREVGATAFKAFKQAKEHFAGLEKDVGDGLGDIDPRPDAQAVFRILQMTRNDARRARRDAPRQPVAAPAPPPPPRPVATAPGLFSRARRLAGRSLRTFRRLVHQP
ncbi:glycosyltransferase family 2 protein [Propionicimonas sp.]|uniref:glycosyltransferase family 2 protein n=1 Tax=Propionicimonas sp. TaxID=1955623 RepID=UPI0039E66BD5